ncbi:DDE-type integrase/transposase/recombinase [Actinoplanes sp. NPDC049265]|uniref:DDE-type integrase/transposase/recombinase n=1 Tax=Actinoplanes sp. NPDC049265 TaxID=3363902 RepID=UPI0037210C39
MHRRRSWSTASSPLERPNRLWVADATRIPCGEGMFWPAAVRDVFSRRIVGWKTSNRCDTDLILAALEYGIFSRDVSDRPLIHHSGRDRLAPRPSQITSPLPRPEAGNHRSVKAGETQAVPGMLARLRSAS